MKRGLFTSFWHREVSGKFFLRALYSQFSHFSIQYIANMSFSQFCMYFRFKYTPLVNTTKWFMKRGLFTSFWHREVSGKVFLRALYSQFSHFSIQYIANMSFSQFCMYFRFKYTPLVNTTMVYEKGSIYVFLASRSFGESVS